MAQVAGYYFNWLSILGGWHPNEAEAMALFWEDESVRIRKEIEELTLLGGLDSSKEARELRSISSEFRTMKRQGIFFGK